MLCLIVWCNGIWGGFAIRDEIIFQWCGCFGIRCLTVGWGGLRGQEVIYCMLLFYAANTLLSPSNCLNIYRTGCWLEGELGDEGRWRNALSITEGTTAKAMPKFCFWLNGEDRMTNTTINHRGGIHLRFKLKNPLSTSLTNWHAWWGKAPLSTSPHK